MKRKEKIMKGKEKMMKGKSIKFSILAVSIVVVVLSSLVQVHAEPTNVIDHKQFRSVGEIPSGTWISPGSKSPTDTGRPPRIGPNILVNDLQQPFPKGLLGRSETTIATADNQHLVAGWNDAQGFCGPPYNRLCTPPPTPGISGYAFSSDGGLTWTDGSSPPVINHVFTRGDPWLDSGGLDGDTVYYANLIVNDIKGDNEPLGVGVHRGKFAGHSFAWNDVHTFDSPKNAINPNSDFYDKEAIAAAKDGTNVAYVSLTNFQELCGKPQWGFGQIEVWRTHDGGDSWQGPSIAGPEAPDSVANCGDIGTLQQSSVPAIGPNGEVYVVWQYGPTFSLTDTSTNGKIVIARSLDRGATFNSPVKVADINSMFKNPPIGYNRGRLNDHPRIAVATSGPDRGRVYVTFYSAVSPVTSLNSLISSQIFISYSDDKGLTWSTPKELASSLPLTGIKRFWPVVTLEPGGNVDVIYYEGQESSTTSLVDTFWVQSTDGGKTFNTPIKVSTATSNWGKAAKNITPNFGDYIGSAFGGNRVFPIWADGRNGVPDVFFANILGAGKS